MPFTNDFYIYILLYLNYYQIRWNNDTQDFDLYSTIFKLLQNRLILLFLFVRNLYSTIFKLLHHLSEVTPM